MSLRQVADAVISGNKHYKPRPEIGESFCRATSHWAPVTFENLSESLETELLRYFDDRSEAEVVNVVESRIDIHKQIKELLEVDDEEIRKRQMEAIMADDIMLADKSLGSLYWLFGQALELQNLPNLSYLDIMSATILALQSNDTDALGKLIDMMGLASVAMVTEARHHSARILSHYKLAEKVFSRRRQPAFSQPSQPSIVPIFTPAKIETGHDIAFSKSQEKLNRLLEIAKANRSELIAIRSILNQIAFEDVVSKPRTPKIEVYHSVEDAVAAQTNALPEGCKVVTTKETTEVTIPMKPSFQADPESLLKIKSVFPVWAREVMKSITSLNFIQSRTFDAAFNSKDNLLVCAPTGAGKTNVALISILESLKDHMATTGMVPPAKKFKIVYIAPLKSLVAEVTDKFGARLSPMGVEVAEFTGEAPLTRAQLDGIHVLVTVPEKWDVVTRNLTSQDFSPLSQLKLLILDEIHLVGEDRGPVLEAIVARSFHHIELTQIPHRIIGLSATLPNWKDVAEWLKIAPEKVFTFDDRFRPIPLEQVVIGVKNPTPVRLNELCYEKLKPIIYAGGQGMVFVHSRGDTLTTAEKLLEMVQLNNDMKVVQPKPEDVQKSNKLFEKCRHERLRNLMTNGIAIHHAGLTRSDRKVVEAAFREGYCTILICTATLAWGVNLPARLVIIKGTNIFKAGKGGYTDLDILDVLQIFGRAGRPDYDIEGKAVLITALTKMNHYLGRLSCHLPLESKFLDTMPDHLNAEIAMGNLTDVKSAAEWFASTFAYVRMRKNPKNYSLEQSDIDMDPFMTNIRIKIIKEAATILYKEHLLRITPVTDTLAATGISRIAAKYYLHHTTAYNFDEALRDETTLAELSTDVGILLVVASAPEFDGLKVRDEERAELQLLNRRDMCPYPVRPSLLDDAKGKVAILIQAYISGIQLTSFSLLSDISFVTQSFGRILRAFAEIAITRSVGVSSVAMNLLEWCKVVDQRIWPNQNPLRHFCQTQSSFWNRGHRDICSTQEHSDLCLNPKIVDRIESSGLKDLLSLTLGELTSLLRRPLDARKVYQLLRRIPNLELNATIQPVTYSILRVTVKILPVFEWSERWCGKTQSFKLWLEDPSRRAILHSEDFILRKEDVLNVPPIYRPGNSTKECTRLDLEAGHSQYELVVHFPVPLPDPRPPQYILTLTSDRWVGVKFTHVFSLDHLLLPLGDHQRSQHTDLLPLDPLPVSVLGVYSHLYKFKFLNPIQSQTFHILNWTDENCLIGAPTGSGKTICAELALLRLFKFSPGRKMIYIAPLKALAKERLDDWKKRFRNKIVVELSGDYSPDITTLQASDIIITTPEKWDGISRHWQHRKYVQQVGLVVLDEIHLLGQDRGAILEVIVSRMRYISCACDEQIRFVGLSTALANASNIADWLGVGYCGLFNFRPSVRPVPCKVYVSGFSDKGYCPRMAAMNKPTFLQILALAPEKPTLVFVSSRRQTSRTADAIITLCKTYNEAKPISFLHLGDDHFSDFEALVKQSVKDETLRQSLVWGVGMHHAGLNPADRAFVEEAFINGTIQILVATSTLAWGVNLPARLVIIKGTEYYDHKTHRYVDMPITDILQMAGRAGRPQFDTEAVATVFTQESKKQFYRKFLYDPFPVESSLHLHLTEHFNAEIAAKSIHNRQQAFDFLTWTYFFRRLYANPSYYNPDLGITGSYDYSLTAVATQSKTESLKANIVDFLKQLVDQAIVELLQNGCVSLEENDIKSTPIGKIASLYYISPNTVSAFAARLNSDLGLYDAIGLICNTVEINGLPVRHNEDIINEKWSETLPLPIDLHRITTPHAKAQALLQMQMFKIKPPVIDYIVDCQSLLSNVMRLIQAAFDTAILLNKTKAALSINLLLQLLTQATNPFRHPFLTLPHITPKHLQILANLKIVCLPQLINHRDRLKLLTSKLSLTPNQANQLNQALDKFPITSPTFEIMQRGKPKSSSENSTFVIAPKQSASIHISLNQSNKVTTVYAPCYPTERSHNYWCLLTHGDFLIDAKRTSGSKVKFTFETTAVRTQLTVYILSDSYHGIDQEMSLCIEPGNQSDDPKELSNEVLADIREHCPTNDARNE